MRVKKLLCFILALGLTLSVYKYSALDPEKETDFGENIYSDQFLNEDYYTKDWTGDTADFTVNNQSLNGKSGFKGIQLKNEYSDFILETAVNGNARFVFHAQNGIWLLLRYYIEVDFAGAIVLRNGNDATLTSSAVKLNNNEYNRIVIKCTKTNLDVYLNGNKTPALTYSSISIFKGNFGIITTNVNTSVNYYNIYKIKDTTEQGNPYEPTGDLIYSDEFTDTNRFSKDWQGDTSYYNIANGKMIGESSFRGISLNSNYENFVLDTSFNNNLRVVFYAVDNIWLSNRYYVELDFAGAVKLCDGNDRTLVDSSIDVTRGDMCRLIIKSENSDISIYINNSSTPVLTYRLKSSSNGMFGFITTNSKTSIDYFKIYSVGKTVPDYCLEGTKVYFDDFNDNNLVNNDWQGNIDNFNTDNKCLVGDKGFKGIMLNGTYENCELDISVDSSIRIVFYANQNMWLKDRYYVELDFGGSVKLCDGNDNELASSLAVFNQSFNNVTLRMENGNIKVYINKKGTPIIDYNGLMRNKGNFALMTLNNDCRIDYFTIYDLVNTENKSSYEPVGDIVYDDSFTDSSNFDSVWVDVSDDGCCNFKDGVMSIDQGFLGAINKGRYQNFDIDTAVDSNTRIVFRAQDSNIYLRNRYYIEVDFDGAILLYSGTDNLLVAANANLVKGKYNRIVIHVLKSEVFVYVNNNAIPTLEYNGLISSNGNIGLMSTVDSCNIDYFKIYKLEDSEDEGVINPVILSDVENQDDPVLNKKFKGYFTDFSDKDEVYKNWYSINGFKTSDGFFSSVNNISGSYYSGLKFKNCDITSVCNNTARFIFRQQGTVLWTSSKYYVEVDFGGMVSLRNTYDTSLKKISLSPGTLKPDVNAKIRVNVAGNTVRVYINDCETPCFEYNELVQSDGYVGLSCVNSATSFAYYSSVLLDYDGQPVGYSDNIVNYDIPAYVGKITNSSVVNNLYRPFENQEIITDKANENAKEETKDEVETNNKNGNKVSEVVKSNNNIKKNYNENNSSYYLFIIPVLLLACCAIVIAVIYSNSKKRGIKNV